MPEAPGFIMPGRVQLAGSWRADSGGIHYSDGSTPFKAQEEGSAPLAFVQVVWRRERSPPSAMQARNWRLAGGNVTFQACALLKAPWSTWLPGKANRHSTCSIESDLFGQLC